MCSNALQALGERPKVVAAIGGFDGLHKGHRLLLCEAKEAAQKLDVPLVVFTFSPVPKAFLNKDGFSGSLFNPESNEKEDLLKALGVDRICMLKFDEELADLTPQAFIEKYLSSSYDIQNLYVGENFTFGAGGKGDASLLQKYFKKVTVVPLLRVSETADGGVKVKDSTAPMARDAEEPSKTYEARGLKKEMKDAQSSIVSSSAIREALLEGDVEKAEQFLGHPFTLTGEVVHGKGQGRKLGFPTANVNLPKGQIVPQAGVYAAEVTIHEPGSQEEGSRQPCFAAAVNIGTAPTLGEASQPILEAHLLDYSGDLYGKTITVSLKKQLRREQKFSSVAELVDTVQLNVDQTRKLLGGGK